MYNVCRFSSLSIIFGDRVKIDRNYIFLSENLFFNQILGKKKPELNILRARFREFSSSLIHNMEQQQLPENCVPKSKFPETCTKIDVSINSEIPRAPKRKVAVVFSYIGTNYAGL